MGREREKSERERWREGKRQARQGEIVSGRDRADGEKKRERGDGERQGDIERKTEIEREKREREKREREKKKSGNKCGKPKAVPLPTPLWMEG